MNEQKSIEMVETDSGWEFRATMVSRVSMSLRVGDVVGAGSRVGTAHQLHESVVWTVPRDAPVMLVTEVNISERQESVAYRAVVARCTPLDVGGDGAAQAQGGGQSDDALAFVAPMSGQFYRRPSPEEPAFMSVGDVIEPGQQIGLVEVMKFFYPLEFEAPEGQYELVSLEAEDSTAIDAGQVIARFRRVESEG